jgi:Flp pilus assembly protein TadG
MRIDPIFKAVVKMHSLVRRIARNNKGVAAVEFAMIAPIMLMLLIGTLEMGTAYTIDRRVSAIASSIADLVARETDTMDDAKLFVMSDKIARSLLAPYNFAPIKIHVVSVKADPADATNTTVHWSRSYKAGDADMTTTTSPYAPGSAFTVPVGLMAAGSYLVAVEVTYDFTPFVFGEAAALTATGTDAVATGAYQMKDRFYLAPRGSNPCVKFTNVPCN